MSNEVEQARYIVEYGARLAGVAQRAIERIVSHSHLQWISAAEDEFALFEHVVEKWTQEFKGSEQEKKHFQAFTVNAKEVFCKSIFKALQETAVIRFAEESEFVAELRLAREESERRRAMGIDDESVMYDYLPSESTKPNIIYRTYDDITANVLFRDPEFPNWLVKRSSEITEDILVALSVRREVSDTLKLLEKQINKLRNKLWDHVRLLRPQAENEAILTWVRRTTANAANYCVVVLTGASKNVLDAEQSKLYESGIRLIHQNYVSEIFNMNTNNTQTTTDEVTDSTVSSKEIDMTTETTFVPTVAQISEDSTYVDFSSATTETDPMTETTLVQEQPNFLKRIAGSLKSKAAYVAETVRAIDWKNTMKIVVFSAMGFLMAVFFAWLYMPVLVAVVFMNIASAVMKSNVFTRITAFTSRKFVQATNFFKGLFGKSTDIVETADDLVAEPVAA